MPIVLISESLLLRATVRDGRILRDRMLSGFCVRLNPRKVTFRVATSVAGKQFRMNLGHWPLMSVEEARARAMELLAQCRRGVRPERAAAPVALPTLREVYADYGRAKGLKESSMKRYESILRTHFGDWLDRPVTDLGSQAFTAHCRAFSKSGGAALVELGRGLFGSVIKFTNALHGSELVSPFTKLAAVGLLPDRAQPRARVLQEGELPAWRAALDKLGERQRDFLLLTLYTNLAAGIPAADKCSNSRAT